MSEVLARHMALTLPYDGLTASEVISRSELNSIFVRYADALLVGGAVGVRLFTDPVEWGEVTGCPIGDTTWGMIDRARGRDSYSDPREGNADDPFLMFLRMDVLMSRRGIAESVIAHEITHLRFRTLGHGVRFFKRVQESIDTVNVASDEITRVGDVFVLEGIIV